jgi:hypothetical protein
MNSVISELSNNHEALCALEEWRTHYPPSPMLKKNSRFLRFLLTRRWNALTIILNIERLTLDHRSLQNPKNQVSD